MNEYNHTFFKFMHDVIDSGVWASLSSSARALYPVLCRFTNESFKHVWPGTDELLRLTGFKTKRSLQHAKKELVNAGLIDIITGSGRTSSRYYFRFDYKGSNINLDSYRDTVVSLRGGRKYPAGDEKPDPMEGTEVSPNNINININTNNEKQEGLLKNMENLIKNFIANTNSNESSYKQQIITSMLKKYGKLEIGEAIKIAIKRGKNGDINYLDGILKNRNTNQKSQIKVNFKEQNNPLTLLEQNYKKYIPMLEYYYKYNNIHYLKAKDKLPIQEIEAYLFKNGFKTTIIESDQNIKENIQQNIVI